MATTTRTPRAASETTTTSSAGTPALQTQRSLISPAPDLRTKKLPKHFQGPTGIMVADLMFEIERVLGDERPTVLSPTVTGKHGWCKGLSLHKPLFPGHRWMARRFTMIHKLLIFMSGLGAISGLTMDLDPVIMIVAAGMPFIALSINLGAFIKDGAAAVSLPRQPLFWVNATNAKHGHTLELVVNNPTDVPIAETAIELWQVQYPHQSVEIVIQDQDDDL